MIKKTFYRCSCFFRNNIYLEQLGLHVHYKDDQQFRDEYRDFASTQFDIEQMLSSVKKEIHRRETLDANARQRKDQIRREYQPLDRDIYHFQHEFLSDQFKELCVQLNKKHPAVKDYSNGIYAFPVFTEQFSSRLLAELKHFQNSPMPKGRPNTMNKNGILLDELGMTEFIDRLRIEYLNPLARAFYGDEYLGETGLDSHRAFIVSYKIGEDVELDYHYDNAEITLNISLGEEFQGGDLFFGTMAKANRRAFTNFTFVEHRTAFGIFHRGQHLHGSEAITSGSRYNLIIWMRSSSVRNRMCPMCWQKPSELIVADDDSYADGMTCSPVDNNPMH